MYSFQWVGVDDSLASDKVLYKGDASSNTGTCMYQVCVCTQYVVCSSSLLAASTASSYVQELCHTSLLKAMSQKYLHHVVPPVTLPHMVSTCMLGRVWVLLIGMRGAYAATLVWLGWVQ